ncbi:MAG: winged helix DNA-binding protein, partial [Acidimicrobiales bacterium]
VIQALWETDSQTSEELARKLEVSHAHVEAVVARLERAHWVRQATQKEHPSETVLHLTESGKATEKGFAALGTVKRRQLNFGLTEADRKLLHEHLEASYPSLIR